MHQPTLRGVAVEKVIVSTTIDPFLSLRALSAYSGLSVRRLRQLIDSPPSQALPAYRLGRKILVRRSHFDLFMDQYACRGKPGLVQALKTLGLN